MLKRGRHFRDNPKLGDGNFFFIHDYLPPFSNFRDNPKLGDGKFDMGFMFNNCSSHFRDNPKLGDGKSVSTFCSFSSFLFYISEITPN